MSEKIVLAYSGGLDTSVILKWLQDTYGYEVVTFTADVGQDDSLVEVADKAKKLGCKDARVVDLKEKFVSEYIFPMWRANAVYENDYLLGTAIARPLIAYEQIKIANEVGAKYVSHGATGKGNDQIRFEMGYYACNPEIKVIAPWRIWSLSSRDDLVNYALKNGVNVPMDKRGEAPYSIDSNALHNSFEGKSLENPSQECKELEDMLIKCKTPENAEDKAEIIEIIFKAGDPIALNGVELSPFKMLDELNKIGGRHGVGIIDIVENRSIGMKSRGVYETPGGSIVFKARRDLETLALDRDMMRTRDSLSDRYALLVYNGLWFGQERLAIQTLMDHCAKHVNGKVRIKLYKGNIIILSRELIGSSVEMASFDGGCEEMYSHKDADGFIRIQSLPFRMKRKK